MQRVHERVPINTTFPPKTTVHTNPLFNKLKLMNLPNHYVYHVFLELFKAHIPISLFTLFNQSQMTTNFILHLPRVTIDISKIILFINLVLYGTA